MSASVSLYHFIEVYGSTQSNSIDEKKDQKKVTSEDVLEGAIRLGSQVKSIKLYGNCGNRVFSLDLLKKCLAACPNCTCIDFSYCEFLEDSLLKKIAKICRDNKLEKIQLCSLPQITEAGLAHFEKVSSLKEIDARRCLHINARPVLNMDVKYGEWLGYEE
jgi:hypothetical protein